MAKTQREMFAEIKALAEVNGREDIATFCDERVAQLDKKKNRTATKKSDANAELKVLALSALAEIGKDATVTEIMKQDETLNELSNQKVTAVLKALVADGSVERDATGKKTVFRLVEVDGE